MVVEKVTDGSPAVITKVTPTILKHTALKQGTGNEPATNRQRLGTERLLPDRPRVPIKSPNQVRK